MFDEVNQGREFRWQDAEAAIFALRTMAAQITNEETVLPQIIQMIPVLVQNVENL